MRLTNAQRGNLKGLQIIFFKKSPRALSTDSTTGFLFQVDIWAPQKEPNSLIR